MTTVVLDPITIDKLVVTMTGVEVSDETGNIVGLFLPKIRPEDVDQYESPLSEAELQLRARDKSGRPLADILTDLRKLRL